MTMGTAAAAAAAGYKKSSMMCVVFLLATVLVCVWERDNSIYHCEAINILLYNQQSVVLEKD